MSSQIENVGDFLQGISDEKLAMTQYSGQVTIVQGANLGFRLDHQGMNTDKREHPHAHRVYIQPINGGGYKSKTARDASVRDTGAVVARCHASDEATSNEIRQALLDSFCTGGKKKGGKANNKTELKYAPPRSK
ncbi:hypothetical protein V8F33_000823 [Rhypophila sp. PSN 637]